MIDMTKNDRKARSAKSSRSSGRSPPSAACSPRHRRRALGVPRSAQDRRDRRRAEHEELNATITGRPHLVDKNVGRAKFRRRSCRPAGRNRCRSPTEGSSAHNEVDEEREDSRLRSNVEELSRASTKQSADATRCSGHGAAMPRGSRTTRQVGSPTEQSGRKRIHGPLVRVPAQRPNEYRVRFVPPNLSSGQPRRARSP